MSFVLPLHRHRTSTASTSGDTAHTTVLPTSRRSQLCLSRAFLVTTYNAACSRSGSRGAAQADRPLAHRKATSTCLLYHALRSCVPTKPAGALIPALSSLSALVRSTQCSALRGMTQLPKSGQLRPATELRQLLQMNTDYRYEESDDGCAWLPSVTEQHVYCGCHCV